jgi:hypothetical protein
VSGSRLSRAKWRTYAAVSESSLCRPFPVSLNGAIPFHRLWFFMAASKKLAASAKTATLRLSAFPKTCKSTACAEAMLVVCTAHSAADALLRSYEVMRHQRGRPRGMTTDNEQDILRSMLVMAGAGLDATVKQLVSDALAQLIPVDDRAQNSFEKFVQRRLLSDGVAGTFNAKLMASVLVSDNPQKQLIREYVRHLTDGSLQSVDSLFEVAAALGAEPSAVGLTPAELKPVFETRNKIIHELDINFGPGRRTRTVRSQSSMIRATERLFRLAHALIASVDIRLSKS